MAYTLLAGLIIVIAFVVVLLAGRLLFKGSWVLGWLRGMCGMVLVAVSVLLALSAFDFYSYKQLSKEQTVASISFTKLEDQHYQVSLVDSSGLEQVYAYRQGHSHSQSFRPSQPALQDRHHLNRRLHHVASECEVTAPQPTGQAVRPR